MNATDRWGARARRPILLAVVLAAVILAGSLASGFPLANEPARTAQASAAAVSPLASIEGAATGPSGALFAAAQAQLIAQNPWTAQLNATQWASIWAAIHAAMLGNKAPLEAFEAKASGVRVEASGVYYAIGGAIGTVALILTVGCAIAGPETFGMGCVAAVILAAAFIAYTILFGGATTDALAESAANLGTLMIRYLGNAFENQAITWYDQLQQWNATYNLAAYQAAAAAVDQIANSTWNGPLAMLQSNLSGQYETTLSSDTGLVAAEYVTTANTFNVIQGSENSGGFYCSMEDTAVPINSVSGTTAAFPAPPSGACAASSPSNFEFTQGVLNATYEYGLPSGETLSSAPAVYFDPENTFWVADTSAAFTNVTILPVWALNAANQGAYAKTVAFSSTHQAAVTVSGYGQGSYYIWSYSASAAVAYVPYSFPANQIAATSTQDGFTLLLQANSTSTGLSAGGNYALAGAPCAGNSVTICANAYGAGTPIGSKAQDWGAQYLYNLATTAATVGQAYWTYLHILGYYTKASIPPACLILNPANVLPPTLTLSSMEALNVTGILKLFNAQMFAIASTFNATTSLTSYNYCGKHVTMSTSGGVLPFGTYAFGWVYNPLATKNASGAGPQHFGTPSTWNYSGIVYLSPISAASLTVALNQTWMLPSNSETSVFVQPLTNGSINSARGPFVNAQAPTQCLSYNRSGCNTTGRPLQAIGLVEGNSSLANGSAYPTHLTSGGNWSVYLTACWQAVVGSPSTAPIYAIHPTTCQFNRQTVGAWGSNYTCDYTISLSCSGNGGGPILIGGACGFLTDLAAPFANIPFIGAYACLIAVLIVLVLVIVVIAAVVWAVRRE